MLGEQVPILGCGVCFLTGVIYYWQPGNLATCWQPGNLLATGVASTGAPELATFAGNSWQQLATAGGNLATWQPGNLLATCWLLLLATWQPGAQ